MRPRRSRLTSRALCDLGDRHAQGSPDFADRCPGWIGYAQVANCDSARIVTPAFPVRSSWVRFSLSWRIALPSAG
jgi:hypothetical protein